MRARQAHHGLTVYAIADTHVVLLGLDLADEQRPGCLGFAIQREDYTETDRSFLIQTEPRNPGSRFDVILMEPLST
jgi:hypothetical protein